MWTLHILLSQFLSKEEHSPDWLTVFLKVTRVFRAQLYNLTYTPIILSSSHFEMAHHFLDWVLFDPTHKLSLSLSVLYYTTRQDSHKCANRNKTSELLS